MFALPIAPLFLLSIAFGPRDPLPLLPVQTENRRSMGSLRLTDIGQFGLPRKARKTVPAHLHTGIDIARPGTNYKDEPILPIADGVVISTRNDGPYAQVIIAHELNQTMFWTVYEHVAGIRVKPGDPVNPKTVIARFMNKDELNRFGWQFDHFHFELLKNPPMKLAPDKRTPTRHYASYTLICHTDAELQKYFYDPLILLKQGP